MTIYDDEARTGGFDVDNNEIFVRDRLSIQGSSNIYTVKFDEENLRYIGKAEDGCTLSGSQFKIARIERQQNGKD